MHILSKVFYLVLSLFLAMPFAYTQSLTQPQAAPGQFKPQDIDAILNSMTEDDFNNILTELSKLSPQELEELEKIGRQVLIDSGIDPDTGKALEQKAAGEPFAKPTEAAAPVKAPEQKAVVKVQNPENVQIILDTIIKQINTLRQKAQGNEQIARRLAQWAEPLQDLIFYLKVINKKVHHERIATKDFDNLFKDLETLSGQLATYQPHIILTEKSVDNDDPYKILGISYDATSHHITAQYNKLKKKHNPKKITKSLKSRNASQKEIDRERRAAELTLSLIQDAYDQLNDPKSKKLVDDKRLTQPTDQLSSAAQSNLTKVLEAISNSVYQNKLLDQLQEFLKKYEPEQLAQKKTFEEAQTQRKKEQVELSKIQPKNITTKYDRTDYPQQVTAPNKYDSFGRGAFPSSFGPTTPTAPTSMPLAPIKKDEKDEKGGSAEKSGGGSGGSGGASKAPKTDEEKRDDDLKKRDYEVKKQAEDKKKKETEAEKKELEQLRAEKKAALEKEPGKPAPATVKPTSNRPAEKISSKEFLKGIGSSLERLKKDMRAEPTRKLFNDMKFKGGLNKKIDTTQLKALAEQLNLKELIQRLNVFYDALPADKKIEAAMRTEWNTLKQEYGKTLSLLSKHISEEENKYTQDEESEDIPAELHDIINLTQQALFAFDSLSQKILGEPGISPKTITDESLPLVSPAA
jgi:hypothetical protein